MSITFRQASRNDLPAIVHMLADDPLGAAREVCSLPLPVPRDAAFDAIERDPNNELVVAVAANATVVGVLQITFIPYLTFDKARPDAIRFYEDLGFVASHEGMKLHFG